MFLHDIIKLSYVAIGYLPNNPYYLISDKEMFEAFTKEDGFFNGIYPCPTELLQDEYEALKEGIFSRIDYHLETGLPLANWVYSYMLMRPITYSSDEANISYLYDLTGIDPPQTLAEFSPQLALACYKVSKEWIKKLPSKYADRPPTMFGETHVTKSLRLNQANILVDAEVT